MQKNKISRKAHEQHQAELLKTIHQLSTLPKLKLFLNDLLTPAELQAIAERWQVAKLLHQGLTQREVAKTLGVSVTTVTRVARCLADPTGGYQQVLGGAL